MSENTQAQPSETTEQIVPVEEPKTYTAEQLAKRLSEVNSEAKKYRQSNAELKQKLADAERIKLEESGNYKQLADQYKSEAQQAKEHALKLKSAFATKTISDQVSLEATRLGCVDPDVVLGILDMDNIAVDDNFRVDQASVKSSLEQIRLNKPYLFKKQTPVINDLPPGKQLLNKPQKAINELSKQEIEKLLVQNFSKK